MDAAQVHLALTHVPVVLSFAGLIMLIVALLRKNDALTKTALYVLLLAGIFAVPVYFSGEGAEEVIEHLPGVSETVIEEHEEFASLGMGIVASCGLISLIGLLVYKKHQFVKYLKVAILLFAIVSATAMAWTAHLGGQVRHPELKSTFDQTVQQDNQGQKSDDD